MKILIAAVLLVGLCIFGMCFNIIFRKNGQFPETEIEKNKEMRKRGIVCAREAEIKMWRKKKQAPECETSGCGDCHSCGL